MIITSCFPQTALFGDLMKYYFLLLSMIILCVSCQKRDEEIYPIPVTVEEIISEPEPVKTRTLQEIIEWYAVTSTPQKGGIFSFQIEGNFTGSGNKEIIAFYEFFSIDTVLCFVLDPSGERIENVYQIKNLIIPNNLEGWDNLPEILGSPIIFNGWCIGRFSDFNGNGVDELFINSGSIRGKRLRVLEFNNNEFVDLLDMNSSISESAISVDPDEKTLNITIEIPLNSGVIVDESMILLAINYNLYKWDSAKYKYELFSAEMKRYSWNRNIKEYIEVFASDFPSIMYVASKEGTNPKESLSSRSKVLDTISYGTKVIVQEVSSDKETINGIRDFWYKCSGGNSEEGYYWIFGSDLSTTMPENIE